MKRACFYLFRKGDDPAEAERFYESYAAAKTIVPLVLLAKRNGSMLIPRPEFGHTILKIADFGFDCNTYWAVRDMADECLFFNSHSVILKPGFEVAFEALNHVGLCGLSSNYESIHTNLVNEGKALKALVSFFWFKPSPNFHVRTNGFAMRSNVMDKIKVPFCRTKIDAQRFESGRNGLTAQVLRLGLGVSVCPGFLKDNRTCQL